MSHGADNGRIRSRAKAGRNVVRLTDVKVRILSKAIKLERKDEMFWMPTKKADMEGMKTSPWTHRSVATRCHVDFYSRVTSTKSPSFCVTTFSARITNLTVPLRESHDYGCYISKRIPAPSPYWCRNTGLRACEVAYRFANITCIWSWRLSGINSVIYKTLKLWNGLLPPS